MPRYRLILFFFACLVLAAACGPSAEGPVPDPCSLLSTDELGQALGGKVDRGMVDWPHANSLGQKFCYYPAPGTCRHCYVQIGLITQTAFEESLIKANYTVVQLFKDNRAKFKSGKDVMGLGDKAFWGPVEHGPGGNLHVLWGDWYINVVLVSPDRAHDQIIAVTLAKKVMRRLAERKP